MLIDGTGCWPFSLRLRLLPSSIPHCSRVSRRRDGPIVFGFALDQGGYSVAFLTLAAGAFLGLPSVGIGFGSSTLTCFVQL
ncbi:hypothetical protein BRC96_02185 [Halobacteriales archaeon QS_6_64_34]|nr:MAG: hypothetical protein BRC96_02185 [Halobacteriales archaeon QS_6_64_34]